MLPILLLHDIFGGHLGKNLQLHQDPEEQTDDDGTATHQCDVTAAAGVCCKQEVSAADGEQTSSAGSAALETTTRGKHADIDIFNIGRERWEETREWTKEKKWCRNRIQSYDPPNKLKSFLAGRLLVLLLASLSFQNLHDCGVTKTCMWLRASQSQAEEHQARKLYPTLRMKFMSILC